MGSSVLAVVAIIAIVLLYAIRNKGRVRADLRFLGTAFSLEVEDKNPGGDFPVKRKC